jgi:hypothetical protein
VSGSLGVLRHGDYVPGIDGRAYGDLNQVERLEVITAYYRAFWATCGELKRRLEDEAAKVAKMPDRAHRIAYMERAKTERPGEYETLASLVRVAYRIHVETTRQAALL